jgi:hypothetical protein
MRNRLVLIGIFITVLVTSCAAADVTWQPRHVTFAEAATISGTVLPAGEYKVEHVMRGEEHIMAFTNVDNKKLRAESKCHMVKSLEKEKHSIQAYEMLNGQNWLRKLIFKGDVFIHELY